METSDSSTSSNVDKSSCSGRVVGLSEYLFQDGPLSADAGRPANISVAPSWRARERVAALDWTVWATAGGSSKAERVLLRPVGSEFPVSFSFLSFFSILGGMIGVGWCNIMDQWSGR